MIIFRCCGSAKVIKATLNQKYKMSSHTRILVKLYKKQADTKPRLANFSECILDYFGITGGFGHIYVQLKDNYLIVSDAKLTGNDEVPIKHPVFCPVLNLSPEMASSLPHEISTRGVDVGAAVVLESCDGKVLLTRRARHLRIFPGLWVPPGGHVEEDESLMDAGLRELREETGLELKSSDCVNQKIDLLALWESVFPPKLSVGPPKRHHIVVYFHARLVQGLTADVIESRIKFDPGEVDACAWLDREMVSAIAQSFDEDHVTAVKNDHLPKVFRAVTLDSNKKQCITEWPTAPLFSVLSDDEGDKERVSTGTKFALQQFLQLPHV